MFSARFLFLVVMILGVASVSFVALANDSPRVLLKKGARSVSKAPEVLEDNFPEEPEVIEWNSEPVQVEMDIPGRIPVRLEVVPLEDMSEDVAGGSVEVVEEIEEDIIEEVLVETSLKPVFEDYTLRPGDVLSVFIFGEKELSGAYEIGPEGFINMPLVGALEVQNLEVDDVQRIVRAALEDGYLVDPDVSVSVKSHRPFYILGEVRAPGSYTFSSNLNILNAVAIAGGFTYRANKKKVKILRSPKTDVSSNYEEIPVYEAVRPGDIIVIKERFF